MNSRTPFGRFSLFAPRPPKVREHTETTEQFDGQLFELFEDRIGGRAFMLREADKDFLGLMYAEAVAKGGDATNPDDDRLGKVDLVADELITARVREAFHPADVTVMTDEQLLVAGEDTRPLSRNYQRAQALLTARNAGGRLSPA